MLSIDSNDLIHLQSVLEEHSLDDVASTVVVGGFLQVTLPCFNDEQAVMDDLDFRGVGFSFTHK